MNKTGNKVDVPFGKLLTRILEDIFFLAILGERPTVFVSFLLGKTGFEGLMGRRGGTRTSRNLTGLTLHYKTWSVIFQEGQFKGNRVSSLVLFSCGFMGRASPWHEWIPFCRLYGGSPRVLPGLCDFLYRQLRNRNMLSAFKASPWTLRQCKTWGISVLPGFFFKKRTFSANSF